MPRVVITGMPDIRPGCKGCGVPLKYWTHDTWGDGETRGKIIARRFLRFRGYGGLLFCTLRCALEFAVDAHRAGYARTTLPKRKAKG